VWQNEHQDLNILVMAVDQWDIHHGCEQHKIQEEGRKREGRGKEEGRVDEGVRPSHLSPVSFGF